MVEILHKVWKGVRVLVEFILLLNKTNLFYLFLLFYGSTFLWICDKAASVFMIYWNVWCISLSLLRNSLTIVQDSYAEACTCFAIIIYIWRGCCRRLVIMLSVFIGSFFLKFLTYFQLSTCWVSLLITPSLSMLYYL